MKYIVLNLNIQSWVLLPQRIKQFYAPRVNLEFSEDLFFIYTSERICTASVGLELELHLRSLK